MDTENGDPGWKLGDYEVIEPIESGSFAAKFLVLHKTENRRYMLKKISLSKQTDKVKRTAHQEVDLITKLRHPYIVEFRDAWVDADNHVYIITNYCERGDMYEIIRRAKGSYFPEEMVCKWLTQMLLAVDYLHSNRVHHRNLKLSDIFVTKENDIQIGDVALSRLLDEEGFPSSVHYLMPELIAGAPYSYKSDIWSLGCCIFEIAARQQAFKASDMTGLIDKINRSVISPLPIIYSANLKQIIKSMLRKSPEHRPTAAELLRQPHLQPFLLYCRDPSPTFLPVKSPSPKIASGKKAKTPSSSGSKNIRHRETKPKQKELLPFFDEIKNMQVPSLLDPDLSIDDILETKRVDPTSYSGKISTDSEDSKSGDAVFETNTEYRDDDSKACSSSSKEKAAPVNDVKAEKLAASEECECKNETGPNLEQRCSSSEFMDHAPLERYTGEPAIKSGSSKKVVSDNSGSVLSNELANARSCEQSNGASSGVIFSSKSPAGLQVGNVGQTRTDTHAAPNPKEKHAMPAELQETSNLALHPRVAATEGEDSASNIQKPVPQRADALESLLELCADLLRQDKLDELTGILKPFGHEMVSSRETAIWLTKSLMNAKKMTKDS